MNNVKFCNNQIYYNIPFYSLNLNALLIVIYLHRPITADKCNLLQRIVREVGFEPTIILT
nr:MAG TPA: hypothetical protein [Caudoviricetes sp.]